MFNSYNDDRNPNQSSDEEGQENNANGNLDCGHFSDSDQCDTESDDDNPSDRVMSNYEQDNQSDMDYDSDFKDDLNEISKEVQKDRLESYASENEKYRREPESFWNDDGQGYQPEITDAPKGKKPGGISREQMDKCKKRLNFDEKPQQKKPGSFKLSQVKNLWDNNNNNYKKDPDNDDYKGNPGLGLTVK